MKFNIVILFMLFQMSCNSGRSLEEFKELCPHDFDDIRSHYLKVPLDIIPHKLNYKVGDTIIFRSEYSDSIVDIAANETFLIKDFPFGMVSSLYRFYDEFNFDSGFIENTSIVDEIYNPVYLTGGERPVCLKAKTMYEGGIYKFEQMLICDKPGRYIMFNSDVFSENSGRGEHELNAEAEAIEFEGKCDIIPMFVLVITENNNHLEEFMDELLFLDNEIFLGKILSSEQGSTGPLGRGGLVLERNGFFGFEVSD